jgi:hypothetical protein
MKNIKILILIFLPFFLFSQEDYKSYENYFPSSKCGEIVHYKYYSVSYCDENKISEWAIYSLTNDNFNDIGSVFFGREVFIRQGIALSLIVSKSL